MAKLQITLIKSIDCRSAKNQVFKPQHWKSVLHLQVRARTACVGVEGPYFWEWVGQGGMAGSTTPSFYCTPSPSQLSLTMAHVHVAPRLSVGWWPYLYDICKSFGFLDPFPLSLKEIRQFCSFHHFHMLLGEPFPPILYGRQISMIPLVVQSVSWRSLSDGDTSLSFALYPLRKCGSR